MSGSPLRELALRDFHRSRGGRFLAARGGEAIDSYAGQRSAEGRPGDLVVADLSALPRRGLAGPGANSALAAAGFAVPAAGLTACLQRDRSLLCRLTRADFFWLAPPDTATEPADLLRWPADRSDCWDTGHDEGTVDLLVAGARARPLLSHLTSFDVRATAFPDHSVAATMLLSLNALIVRWDVGGTVAFRIAIDAGMAPAAMEEVARLVDRLGGALAGGAALATSMETGTRP